MRRPLPTLRDSIQDAITTFMEGDLPLGSTALADYIALCVLETHQVSAKRRKVAA